MESISELLAKKQVDYLYQSLNLLLIGFFIALSLVLYLAWDLTEINNKIIIWYFCNLFILSLRWISNVFYQRIKPVNNPLRWMNLFLLGACLNGIVIALLIFIIPADHHIYASMLIAIILIAAITTLGAFRWAYFTYLITVSIPVITFYFAQLPDLQPLYLYTCIIFIILVSITVLRFNSRLISGYRVEIENQSLTTQLEQETEKRSQVENELQYKTQELQLLNESLEHIVKEKTNELENLAFYDTLTQLPNRHNFYNYLERTLSRNKITREAFALFFIDLDEFKIINDTLGHDFGDQVLIEAASRLRASTRVDDFIARISGDEFIIVIKQAVSETKLAKVANNIIQSISQAYSFHDTQAFLSCSIGISLYPQDGENTHTLLKYSDLAMYHAKENGKNSFQFYNQALYEVKAKKFILSTELKTAIDRNELHLVYQPQVNCQTGAISSMEVLLRWHSKKFGPVPLYKFIPLAEESNQIIKLEEFVLKTALTQVKYWNEQAKQPFRVGINISGIHFQQKNFVLDIEGILTQLNVDPAILELELTESAIMNNTRESVNKLRYLKSLGIRISIDDFGTGYSSMSYLKQLPIDTLKIDKSFINGTPDDQDNKAIIQAIIVLAKQFKLETVAEGVENEQQLEYLKQAGCDLIQGYYFYKPLFSEDFEKKFNLAASQ